MTITITELQKRVGQINIANGWREDEADLDQLQQNNALVARIGLCCTEVGEAIEEVRNGKPLDKNYFTYKPVPASFAVEFSSGQEATEAWEKSQTPKPEGVPSEIADVAIRIFDTADSMGWNLIDGLRYYMDVSEDSTLAEIRDFLRVQIEEEGVSMEELRPSNAREATASISGIYTALGRAIDDFDKPEVAVVALADALGFCVMVELGFGFDLQEAIDEKLAYNATRGNRHGGKLV